MDFGSPFWGVTIDFLRLEYGGFVFKILKLRTFENATFQLR